MRGTTRFLFIGILGCIPITQKAFAQSKRIVTYIEDVQEERKSTRWTLTEWLRIKERMKLMDVWLAMFSKPSERFAPELAFTYGQGVGESEWTLRDMGSNSSSFYKSTQKSENLALQFWFTNLVSGTTGLRTLNIDLGLEAKARNRFLESEDRIVLGTEALDPGTEKIQQYGVNLRLFGVSSQDSSLVAKAGKFEKDSGISLLGKESGTYWGAEMTLYILSFLGAEGQYYQYLDGKEKLGSRAEGMGFLEIYNLRIGYGQARNDWSSETTLYERDLKEFDRFLSVRLYF